MLSRVQSIALLVPVDSDVPIQLLPQIFVRREHLAWDFQKAARNVQADLMRNWMVPISVAFALRVIHVPILLKVSLVLI